jgi:hypothetical protein
MGNKGWNPIGYIGEVPAYYLNGAMQEDGAMQEMGAPYVPKAPAKKQGGIPLPAALAAHLKKARLEPYDIYPGYPNAVISSAIAANVVNAETTVHTFTPPTGHYIIINPADLTQEVLFEPYASTDGTVFILGLINIYTRTALLGFQQRLYSAGSEYHNPARNVSSVGNRRRWQFAACISPGDTMETRFLAAAALSPVGSHLDHRFSAKKATP